MNRVITCVTLIKAKRRMKMITILRKIGFVACEISYVLAVILAIMLIPFALLIRAAIEIRAAAQHSQITHHHAKPVYS